MFVPTKIADLELSSNPRDIDGDAHHLKVEALVRWKGVPLGRISAPLVNHLCSSWELRNEAVDKYSWSLICLMIQSRLLTTGWRKGDSISNISDLPPESLFSPRSPMVSVCICTRDRADDLAFCLRAVSKLDYPSFEVIVVDNAPATSATRELVESLYPTFRYVCEPRPGLDWARNRAFIEAKGEILAYTDDDVSVDSLWLKGVVSAFDEGEHVAAVTGLVLPLEIETESQALFEVYGGFSRGFRRLRVRFVDDDPWRWAKMGTGQYGTGANMSFRRKVLTKIGGFDPALDVGTVTNGGGDLEMIFRVLKHGYSLIYEPRAYVKHRHRRDPSALSRQIHANGLGLASHFRRCLKHFPEERPALTKLSLWYVFKWLLPRTIRFAIRRDTVPARLPLSEFYGFIKGWSRYPRAREQALEIQEAYSAEPLVQDADLSVEFVEDVSTEPLEGIAVRYIDVAVPLCPIEDVGQYRTTRIYVAMGTLLLGSIDIENQRLPITALQLAEAISDNLGMALLTFNGEHEEGDVWNESVVSLRQLVGLSESWRNTEQAPLDCKVKVSIVIPTFDRPDDLNVCLQSLQAQSTSREVEIIVVDNNPGSGVTRPIVDQFESVVLVEEERQGISYARNAGIVRSTGAIVIATDDDVIAPPHWLESMVGHFSRHDVMVVTGNVLPHRLDNRSEQLFESYGGLGRGFKSFEVGKDWFQSFRHDAVPTHTLGATANAAFRSSIFTNPKIGLLTEFLGAGMPSAVGEDTYMFYKVLNAGYTVAYEPSAFVWHKHRSTLKALRKQIYGYSKGHIGYNLVTFIEFGDVRGLIRVFWTLPKWRIRQICRHLYHIMRGRFRAGSFESSAYVTSIEIAGNLIGPFSLIRSWIRYRRMGKSSIYAPPNSRGQGVGKERLRDPLATRDG